MFNPLPKDPVYQEQFNFNGLVQLEEYHNKIITELRKTARNNLQHCLKVWIQ